MKSNSLAKNAAFNIIYKILNVIFPFISYGYVARILLADGVGRVSAVQNNISYFVILATLGIPAYGIREMAKVRDNNHDKDVLFSELFLINLTLTICSFCAFFISTHFISIFKEDISLYRIFSAMILLNILNVDWMYQGLEEYVYIALRSSLIKILSLISILFFVKTKDDIYVFAIISVLAICGNYFFNIIHSRKFVNFRFKNVNIKKHLKPLVYLSLCTISTELYARMDITMLDIMQTDTIVGHYTYAHRVVNIAITCLVAVTAVFLPRLTYYFQENREKFNSLLKMGVDMMIFISIPSFLGMIFVAKPLIYTLFGLSFIDAANILAVFSIMIPLKCIGDLVCYQVMMSAGREALLMKSYLMTMMINLIINLMLIPKFGALGAATASVISEIVVFIFVLFFSKKYIDIAINKRNILCVVFASSVMSICLFVIAKIISTLYLRLIISIVLGVLVYFAVNIFMKNNLIKEILAFFRRKSSVID